MKPAQARLVLKKWVSAPSAELVAAIECLASNMGGIEAWLASQPDLFVHPCDTVDPETLGIHQHWSTNLMQFRELVLGDRTIYLFEYQLETLCSTDA